MLGRGARGGYSIFLSDRTHTSLWHEMILDQNDWDASADLLSNVGAVTVRMSSDRSAPAGAALCLNQIASMYGC